MKNPRTVIKTNRFNFFSEPGWDVSKEKRRIIIGGGIYFLKKRIYYWHLPLIIIEKDGSVVAPDFSRISYDRVQGLPLKIESKLTPMLEKKFKQALQKRLQKIRKIVPPQVVFGKK